jgi:hypothetical protein
MTNPLSRQPASVSRNVVVPEIFGWVVEKQKETLEKLHEMATARALDASPFERYFAVHHSINFVI